MASFSINLEEVKLGFTQDVAGHEMCNLVRHKDSVVMDVMFKNPICGANYFSLTTWPYYLCISGDMGTYVFNRMNNMLDFFRGEVINPSYWGEKLVSIDRNCGYKRFNQDIFTDEVLTYFDGVEFPDEGIKTRLFEELKADILDNIGAFSEQELFGMVRNFQSSDKRYDLQEFDWEAGCEDYTHHYIWCCYAIQWGIKQLVTKAT